MMHLFILSFLIGSSLVYAQSPDSEYLHTYLPLNYLQEKAFTRYQLDPDKGVKAPLVSSFKIEGKDYPQFKDWFLESHWAYIPQGKKILVMNNANGQEIWKYPVGMQVAHLIQMKTRPLSVYELRVVQKLANGRWAYGTYIPDSKEANRLQLLQKNSFKVEHFLRSGPEGLNSLSLRRINLRSCRHCHARNTNTPYQYTKLELVGPCEFTPQTKGLKENFNRDHRQQKGREAFEKWNSSVPLF